MTSQDLRTLMSAELDTLAPMPDLVPQVIRQGATQVRRRRLAVGGLVAAAAIGGVAIAPWASGRGGNSDQPAADGTPTATPRAVPSPAPQGGNLVLSDPEVMAAFDAALPDRFPSVEFLDSHPGLLDAGDLLRTEDGQTPLFIDVVLRPGAAKTVCAAQMTCERRSIDGGQAIVGRKDGQPNSVRALLARHSWSTTVSVFTEPRTEEAPITDKELLDLLAHPGFLEMIDSREASDFVPTPSTSAPVPIDPTPSDVPEPSGAPPAPTASPTPSEQSTSPDPVTTEPTEPESGYTSEPPPPTQPTMPPSSQTPTASPTPSAVPTDK